MPDDVITAHGPDRGDRVCRCAGCGLVGRCTRAFDFYTLGPDAPVDGDPIFCQRCFLAMISRRLTSN